MKFNRKLNLQTYINVVDEISNSYFDFDGNFLPQFGEIFAMKTYFNNCVELEEGEEYVKPCFTLEEFAPLLENDEFVNSYKAETIRHISDSYLTFSNAYAKAMEIIDYKKNDANAFATAITSSINAILSSFRNSFSDEQTKQLIDIAQKVADGKIDEDAIVSAYTKSDRFAENSKEIEEAEKIIAPTLVKG